MSEEFTKENRELPNLGKRDLQNLLDYSNIYSPREGSTPSIKGIEFGYVSMPLKNIGGDHVTFMNFERRYDLPKLIRLAESQGRHEVASEIKKNYNRGGFYIKDVRGHDDTDSILAHNLHNSFLIAASYELERHGQITPYLFEILNTRFYEATETSKTIDATYGEIDETGTFKFILQGGCPKPIVYSRVSGGFVNITNVDGTELENSEPIGMKPSANYLHASRIKNPPFGFKQQPYVVNELKLQGSGDILIVATDGLTDHFREHEKNKEELFVEIALEDILRREGDKHAKDIAKAIQRGILDFNKERTDDITYVVVKKK